MSDVTNILERKPHMAGNAVCLHCKHEWQAVSPIGCTVLECPECKMEKGVYRYLVTPEKLWTCSCGNISFFISPEGIICGLCGDYQSGYEDH